MKIVLNKSADRPSSFVIFLALMLATTDPFNFAAAALLLGLIFAAMFMAAAQVQRRDRRAHIEWLVGSQLYKDIVNKDGDVEVRKKLVKLALAMV
jgi:hypothetical protein